MIMEEQKIRLSQENLQTVKNAVAYCFADVVNVDKLTPATKLKDMGDSLDLLFAVQELEKRMEVRIPDSQVEQLKTFADLCNLVQDSLEQE